MAVTYRRANELMLLIAANPSTPAHVLEQLSSEDDPLLLEHVAENPSTPTLTLGYLAGHVNERIRVAVTHNSKAPPDILYALANDEHVDVRFALASNPLLPIQIIHQITDDENPYVAARAKQTLDRLQASVGLGKITVTLQQNIQQKRFHQAS